jgi:hypothetical protein
VQLPEDAKLGGAAEQASQSVDGEDEQLWRQRIALVKTSSVPNRRAWFSVEEHSGAGGGE